jgi:hypothetical protein
MMLLADYQVLLADTEGNLQENIIKLNNILELLHMKILSNETNKIIAMEEK